MANTLIEDSIQVDWNEARDEITITNLGTIAHPMTMGFQDAIVLMRILQYLLKRN